MDFTNTAATLLFILSLLFAYFLVLPFLLSLISLLVREKKPSKAQKQTDFACVVTCYKNLDIAIHLLRSLLQQEYQNYHVYLVADECPPPGEQWSELLADAHCSLLMPDRRLGSKVFSMIFARVRFVRDHDAVLILDPDNLTSNSFLSILNDYLQEGFKAVQGRRAAKNLDTLYACADATGELYKNYIERYVPSRLGSSASIAGSGMAIEMNEFDLYLGCDSINIPLQAGNVIPAEDKILQNFLVRRGRRIPFAWSAVIYDEKVTTGDQVQRQRSRWLFAWFENVGPAFKSLKRGFKKLEPNALIFGFLSLIPPLFLLVMTSFLLGVAGFILWLSTGVWLPMIMMACALCIFVLNLFLSLYLAKAPPAIWSALRGMPLFAMRQFRALFQVKKATRYFMETTHTRSMSLEEVEEEKSGKTED